MIYNPGFENWNLGLFKDFQIKEALGFQFRAEAYDAFNHPNWSGVGTDPTNLTTFMKVTGKSGDVRNFGFAFCPYKRTATPSSISRG